MILYSSLSYQNNIIAYDADIKTNFQTGIVNETNPCAIAAGNKSDPENPSWNEAIHRNEYEYYIAATKIEIAKFS